MVYKCVYVGRKLYEQYTVIHYYPKNLYFLRRNVRHVNINVFGFLVVIKKQEQLGLRQLILRFYVH